MENKFGFTEEEIQQWHEDGFILEGEKDLAVILIHGWTAIPSQGRKLAEAINELGYWVNAIRLTGHGRRPEELEKATVENWVEDISRAIDEARQQLGVKKVVLCGVSMGGNLSLVVSQQKDVEGAILLGTPVRLKNHFWIWLAATLSRRNRYFRKNYPNGAYSDKSVHMTSYQYFPAFTVRESLRSMRKMVFSLAKVTTPTLILQTSEDYMVAKYSPWVIYNAIRSKMKRFYWVKTNNRSHNLATQDLKFYFSAIKEFLKEIEEKSVK